MVLVRKRVLLLMNGASGVEAKDCLNRRRADLYTVVWRPYGQTTDLGAKLSVFVSVLLHGLDL